MTDVGRGYERVAGPDEVTTYREATVAIRGIRDQIAMQNRIFAMCVVIAIGCFGYLFTTTTQTVTTVARMEERLDAMDKRLDGIDTRLDRIDTRLDALPAAIERLLASQKQGAFQ
jgi:hypothetical protein